MRPACTRPLQMDTDARAGGGLAGMVIVLVVQLIALLAVC